MPMLGLGDEPTALGLALSVAKEAHTSHQHTLCVHVRLRVRVRVRAYCEITTHVGPMIVKHLHTRLFQLSMQLSSMEKQPSMCTFMLASTAKSSSIPKGRSHHATRIVAAQSPSS
jgi:hypothetical protein